MWCVVGMDIFYTKFEIRYGAAVLCFMLLCWTEECPAPRFLTVGQVDQGPRFRAGPGPRCEQ